MCTFEEDFKLAIEDIQKERKLQKKHPYNVHYSHLPVEPQFLIKAHIQGGRSGRRIEVYTIGKDCNVTIVDTDIKKTFKKNELGQIIDCIKDFLETPLTNR